MTTASSDAGARQRLAAEYFCNPDLARTLLQEEELRKRIKTVRSTIGYAWLTATDLLGLAQSAIAFGFYRALMRRFANERGLTDDWWIEQRRIHARNGKDRTADLDIITANFAEFAEYYPADGLTQAEVLAAAKIEFRDSIAAPGSDYHQVVTKERTRSRVAVNLPVAVAQHTGPSEKRDPFGYHHRETRKDYLDPESQDRTENVLKHTMLDDDRDIFGPVVTRAVQIALREYGPSALHWLNDLLFFPKRYSDNLRSVGQTEETLGKAEFERVKRDMVRKLPEIHTRMMELLRDDPEIQHMRELFFVPSAVSTPAPKAPRTSIEDERQRHRTRMVARMRQSDRIPKDLTEEQLVALIPAFFSAERDPLQQPALAREIERIRKEAK